MSFDQSNCTSFSLSINNETDQETNMTLRTQIQAIMCCSWLNILLLAVPVEFTLNYTHANEIANF